MLTFSLVGAFAIVIGLYIVLWGKAKDLEEIKEETDLKTSQNDDQRRIVQVLIDESTEKNISLKIDLEEPLLADKLNNVTKRETNHQ